MELKDIDFNTGATYPNLAVRVPSPPTPTNASDYATQTWRYVEASPVLGDWMGGTPDRPLPDYELKLPEGLEITWPDGITQIERTERISHDELFMQMAELWSQRSTCLRGHTAAIIVQDRRPVAVGYNGAAPGLKHCTEVGCESTYVPLPLEDPETRKHEHEQALNKDGCQRAIHAELNAIAWAARHGISTEGATMYTLSAPCLRCAQAIISAGITIVVWRKEYRADRLDLLDKALVQVRRA